jgi:2-methylcitrate dehydratase PrpD
VFGCAAADGVLAACAAQRGMSGDPDVLRTVAGDVTSGGTASGASDAVARVDVKPFCTARQTQAAVQAAVLASAQLGDVALDAVQVTVPEDYRAMIDRPVAADRLTSMMSAQFQIAAALTDDALLYDVARAAPRLPAAGAELMSRVTVVADAELSAAYPETWPARVTLRARDGRELTRQVDDPDDAGWESLTAKHARLGALGDGLETAAGVCRALRGDGRGDARRLLDLIDEPPTLPKED